MLYSTLSEGTGVLQARRRGDGESRGLAREEPPAPRLRGEGLHPPEAGLARVSLQGAEQGRRRRRHLHRHRAGHLQGRVGGRAEGPARRQTASTSRRTASWRSARPSYEAQKGLTGPGA
ncbi:MAG: hypothetical protein MZV64_73295 [Ignavibacteriales bacterium]|nr:hypothetical protein [Ignavibacteriales bacterium]